ncbi:MAG: ribonuclease P protein component [Alteromonas naphthalenivorans]|jgi:ribonuclease P protein component
MPRVTKKISSFTQSEITKLLSTAKVRGRIPGLRILAASPSLSSVHGRILIITPRRSGNSPERNLIRRRLKSIFIEDELSQKNIDLVVIVRREGIDTSFGTLKKLLHRVCNSFSS